MSIAKTVQNLIDSRPFLAESLMRGVINYNNLALDLSAEVARLEGCKVKTSAVVMALRRYTERLRERSNVEESLAHLSFKMALKSHISDFSLKRSPRVLSIVGEFFSQLSSTESPLVEFFELVTGQDELSLCISSSASESLKARFERDDILTYTDDLVAITLTFTGDFLTTPGIIFQSTRMLAWEDINLYEVISTQNELSFILRSSEAPRALEVLQSMQMEKN